MKKLAYILSFVVLMLSMAPCCALEDHTQQVSAEMGYRQQNSQANDCCQSCSPFYTCGTCNGFMTLPLSGFSIPAVTHLPTLFNNIYLQSHADGVNNSIWQPPKLS